MLLAALWGCGPSSDLSLSFPDATPEQYAAAQEAVNEWNANCPVSVHLSKTEGEVPIVIVPENALDGYGGMTKMRRSLLTKEPLLIRIEVRWREERAVYAHEIGHALGLGHSENGVMRWDSPLDSHVTPEDCP